MLDPNTLINSIKSYSLEDQKTLHKALGYLILKKESSATPLIEPSLNPPELPELKIPNEYLVPYTEYLIQSAIEELFNNYEPIYRAQLEEDEPTNNSSIVVTNAYDDTYQLFGQFPHITVEVTQCVITPMYVGDRDDTGITEANMAVYSNNAANVLMPVRIQILARKRNQCAVLGNIVQMILAQTRRILRELYKFREVSYPSLQPGLKVEEHEECFMAVIDFRVQKYLVWNDKILDIVFKKIVYRLIGKAFKDDPEPIVQILLNSNWKMDPNLESYIKRKPVGGL